MPWLRKFRSFANDLTSRSPEPPIDESQPLTDGRKLKLSTLTASGKPQLVGVDEEFRQSIARACFGTRLCPQCEALNLDEWIVGALQSSKDLNLWPEFSALLPTIDESCNFCQFYKNLYSNPDGSTGNFRCFEVRLLNKNHFSVLKSWELFIAKSDTRSGFTEVQMLRTENGPGLRCPEQWPISPFGVDYEDLRKKLAFCDTRDRKKGQKDLSPSPHPIFVIDCDTRQVEILATGAKYVCLSYVWGPPRPSNGDDPGFGYLPSYTERTVEDAITVTSNLHYRYLWVDKYCINQNDIDMKMAQIQQMDYIYTQADLTIVAAAGDHADYGLPGVSKRPRSPRQSFKLGNHILMPCWKEASLAAALQKSKWMERGWTYQEALLSRRRLFFTEHCYLHDCGTCYIEGDETKKFESWKDSPELVNHARMKVNSRWMSYNISSFLPYPCKRIQEYSYRNLTQQSDALNAITGVLHTFEHADPPLYHYYGVPMLQPFKRDKNGVDPRTSNMDGFVQSLRWALDSTRTRERVSNFPSWSWVGWKCPCTIGSLDPTAPTTVTVEIELEGSGARIGWEQFAEMNYLRLEPKRQSHYIWVEAWTFDLATLDAPPPVEEEDVQRTHIIGNPEIDTITFKVFIDLFCKDSPGERERLRTQCKAGKVSAIVLGDVSKAMSLRTIIIVEEMDDDVYQRVGNFDDTGLSLLWEIGPSFWQRGIVELRRRWIRLS